MKQLPYQAQTATGDTFDIGFPLHRETGDPIKVEQLITVLLKTIDDEIAVTCLLYTSPSPRDGLLSRMPSSA